MSREKAPSYSKPTERGSTFLKRLLFSIFSLAFVIGGLLSGYIFVVRLKAFLDAPSVLATMADPKAGLAHIIDMVRSSTPGASTAPSTNDDSAPDWRNKERINILLLGVDQRPDEVGSPSRTDTMIIVTIDPYSKSAGMLSLPRDLWVPIPLDDRNPIEDRINTAHFLGEWRKYPGGGPALAKKTVQYNFGVKIHYYAKVDFTGFRRLVDALGGIDIDVPVALYDNEYPTDDYGVTTIYIPKGRQHLNGEQALQYARSRHQDSDFGRMKRQQQVLLALRDRALQLDVIPRLPQLAMEYRDVVKTDISLQEMLALAAIAREIKSDKIIARSIEGSAVNPIRTAMGADILVPVRKEIEKIVSEVFFDARLREEDARVLVLNGAKVPGLASQAAALLERRGFRNVSVGNVEDGHAYEGVTIIDHTGKKYTVGRLADLFKVPPQRIEAGRTLTDTVDITVILGNGVRIP